MFKSITWKTTAFVQKLRGQFADFKAKFRTELNRKFPPVRKEIDEKKLEFSAVGEVVQHTFSTRKMVAFRGIGLLFVMIGFMLYSTLSYLYLVIAAGIISLALEGVVTFWTRFTRHRGLGILITYLIFIFFLVSGFIIVIPFLVGRGTQILQSIMTHVQGIQHDIMVQGMDVYVRGLRRVPDFLNDDILLYIENTDSASLLQSLMDNLGNIVNLSSSYLKTIGGYAVNIFGNIFSTLGKLIIFLTLSIFFSVSHYEVKYGIKYLFRKTPKSKEKVDEVYEGVASRLKSELLLCLIIGIACYLWLRILSRIGYDLPQKGALALIAGLLEIIPFLWPWLWAVPAAVCALLLHGFPGLLMVIVIYTIIQQLEENFLVPVLMSKTLGINPLLVLVCMLLGGVLMGVIGVILAVPIAVILSIVFPLPEGKEKEESWKLKEESKKLKAKR